MYRQTRNKPHLQGPLLVPITHQHLDGKDPADITVNAYDIQGLVGREVKSEGLMARIMELLEMEENCSSVVW